jgi:hypothetical protein
VLFIILLDIRRSVALLEDCQYSPASLSDKNSIKMKMSTAKRLNETGREKWKYWGKHLLYIKC